MNFRRQDSRLGLFESTLFCAIVSLVSGCGHSGSSFSTGANSSAISGQQSFTDFPKILLQAGIVSSSFQNSSFTSQTGSFTVSFNAVPTQSNEDSVIGLSATAAAAYS